MGANILRGGALIPAWRENTTGSFLAAAETGASFVEFDVQVTRDGVPVLWHDDTLDYGDPAAPSRAPIAELTLAEFKALGAVAASGGGATRLAVVRSFWEEEGEAAADGAAAAPRAFDGYDAMPSLPPTALTAAAPAPAPATPAAGISSSAASASAAYPQSPVPGGGPGPRPTRRPRGLSPPRGRSPPRHWRCARDEGFPTLDEVFDAMPAGVGFDIEVKMATPDHVAVTPAAEVDRVVGPILAALERCCPAGAPSAARAVVLSSFDPDVCAALRARQSRWPVLFLTTGGRDGAHADARRMSLTAALDVALTHGLSGIIADSGALQAEPDFAAAVARRSAGANLSLRLLTYGRENDDPDWVAEQARLGVHGVIVDDVPAVLSALAAMAAADGGGGAQMPSAAVARELLVAGDAVDQLPVSLAGTARVQA